MNNRIEQQVRERAYQLWVMGGRAEGREVDYWCAAERELTAVSEAMPASAAPSVPAAKREAPKVRAPRKGKKKNTAGAHVGMAP